MYIRYMLKIVRKRSRIGHYFPYGIKTNIPSFFHIDIVILEANFDATALGVRTFVWIFWSIISGKKFSNAN